MRSFPIKILFLLLGLVATVAIYLLLAPPIIGMADNWDFMRVTERVGIKAPLPVVEQRSDGGHFCWITTNYAQTQPLPGAYHSTEELFVWIAIALSKGPGFDIRCLAIVHIVFLLGAIGFVLWGVRGLPRPAFLTVAAGLALIGTDAGYLAYFNSFYTESAAMIGLLFFVGASLAVVFDKGESITRLPLLTFSAAFFLASKAQNSVLVLFATAWIILVFLVDTPAYRWKKIPAISVAALSLIGVSAAQFATAPSPHVNLFNSVFSVALFHSTGDPATDLADLGLQPQATAYIGRNIWEPGLKFDPSVFPGQTSQAKLALFYLKRPALVYRISKLVTLANDLPYIGNFPKDSGAGCGARTRAFRYWDWLRSCLAARWFFIPFLFANLCAGLIWRNKAGGWISFIAAMALMAGAVGLLGDMEQSKHLFTFNLMFDVLVFADLAFAAVRVSKLKHATAADLRSKLQSA